MIALSVNLNKIALLRNSRDAANPSVTEHAAMCISAGADGITVHPRPDQRHIRASDCFELAPLLGVEFNIEGNPLAGPCKSQRERVGDYPGFMELVKATKPTQCTLVPDGDTQLTSDHGFDLKKDGDRIAPLISELKQLGIRVSVFMDPIAEQIELARQIGADRIELYTGPYADAVRENLNTDRVFGEFCSAAQLACDIGLGVNAGHDLDLNNLQKFAKLPGLLEVSIGHALTIDAIRIGLANAVVAYQECLSK